LSEELDGDSPSRCPRFFPVSPARFDRRRLLETAIAGVIGVELAGAGPSAATTSVAEASRARLPTTVLAEAAALREPGSLPNPSAPPGTDQVPQIDNFVVVMMENHSFDNILGMLGRGDCFSKGPDGLPEIELSDGHGNLVHAFHMPSECQTNGVGNNWNLAHHSYDEGTNRGFVEASTGEALGYFLGEDLPFTWGMARTFPIADHWFCSVPGQTNPNRRYLLAGTSLGQVADTNPLDLPPNGTIFDALNRYGITWKEYYSDVPSSGVWLRLLTEPAIQANIEKIERFYDDAAAGRLPQFTFIDPSYSHSSEENPQDIQFGDQFLGGVVNAVMHGPQWSKTMLIWTYDEWGGWYDHVPPPRAIPPDSVAPELSPNMASGAFDRYGFRVPGGVVSPYARRDHVSHTVYDHTSILKTLERKWNLPAFTRRDANAHDLFDMVDLEGPPAYARPPRLPASANPARSARCLVTGPGRIPPPSAIEHGAVPHTPSIAPGALPAGEVGVPYEVTLTSAPRGTSARWSVLSDDLPAGLVLGPTTGIISGIPTASGTSGVTIGVSSDRGPVGAQSYTVVVT